MRKTIKITTLILGLFIVDYSYGQFCDGTYKLIAKKEKDIKKNATIYAKDWLRNSPDSLKLPNNIKLNDLKFNPEEDLRWEMIDSLLCEENYKANKEKAHKLILDDKLVVYQIDGHFRFTNSTVESLISFEFDIEGNIIIIEIRPNSNDPYSATYYK